MEVTYLFRKPAFPIICNVNGHLIAARSTRSFQKAIDNYTFEENQVYNIVDISTEGWTLHTDHMVVSPLTLKKRWTKREVIALFNESHQSTENYSMKSISTKRFDQIFREIVDLIVRAMKQESRNA